jgi:hypothetical protein
VKCVDGVLYVRISCHIYNETSEYEKLGDGENKLHFDEMMSALF